MAPKTSKTTDAATNSPPLSPWVAYLIGEKAAESFLQEMAQGVISVSDSKTGKVTKQKLGTVIRPDETARQAFVAKLVEKPSRMNRLTLLVQASTPAQSVMHAIVLDLAERSIRQFINTAWPALLDATNFDATVTTWLTAIPKKPLKATELNQLFLLLHFGRQRQWFDEATVFRLVTLAVTKPTKARPSATPTELDLLLNASASASELEHLLAYFAASKAATAKLHTEIQREGTRAKNLTITNETLTAECDEARAKHAKLTEQRRAAEMKIAELEKQIVSTRASYQHKLDDTRGRVRGVLQGQLTRWLQTSLAAIRATPPRLPVIEERLEEALKLIEKELQWLQPSA